MTDNGIFTVSDLAGTDPHALWITGLPHAEQPHVWEQPQQDLGTHHNQMILNALLFDAQIDRINREIAANPQVTSPDVLRLQANEEARRRQFRTAHPLLASFRRWLSR